MKSIIWPKWIQNSPMALVVGVAMVLVTGGVFLVNLARKNRGV